MRRTINSAPLAIATALAATLAGGCASIVSGQNQTVSVSTPDCPGASCELTNDKGRWYVPTTPGSVVVNRSYADLLVRCTKGEYEPAYRSVPSSTKGMAYGNILFGGVIGAGVDIVNGSAYDYPAEIQVSMACSASNAPAIPFTLGCRVADVAADPTAIPAGYPHREGVRITSVEREGNAARAGLQPGDILVAIDDQRFADATALAERLRKQDPNKGFRLQYWREGTFREIEFNAQGVAR